MADAGDAAAAEVAKLAVADGGKAPAKARRSAGTRLPMPLLRAAPAPQRPRRSLAARCTPHHRSCAARPAR
jgi:hypothetical protein